jgi:CheY-like chemotaxis protein
MFENKTFWVIEDHEAIINDIRRTLLQFQSNCEKVEYFLSPESAIERLNNGENPDLIILDVLLNGSDGNQQFEMSKSFLTMILNDYPDINIMVYTCSSNLLYSLLDKIMDHRGGFVIANKRVDTNQSFINRIDDSLRRIKLIPPMLEGLQRLILELNAQEDRELHLKMLKLMCQNCLRNTEIYSQLDNQPPWHLGMDALKNKHQQMMDLIIREAPLEIIRTIISSDINNDDDLRDSLISNKKNRKNQKQMIQKNTEIDRRLLVCCIVYQLNMLSFDQ